MSAPAAGADALARIDRPPAAPRLARLVAAIPPRDGVTPRRSNWLRWGLRTGATVLIGVVTLMAAVLAFVQTDMGRAVLVSLVEHVAASRDFGVTVGRLEGLVPFDMTARDVTVRDARGAWANVDRLRLAWRPMRLLGGVVDVEAIEADHVRIDRRPDPGPPSATTAPTSPSKIELPNLPTGVLVERLAITELAIGQAVTGRPARLRIEASAGLVDPRRSAEAEVRIARIDGTPGTVTARANFALQTRRLGIDLQATEPTGGLASSLLGLPSLALDLHGDGPLDRWTGSLKFDGGKPDAIAGGSISIATLNGGHRLEGRLEGTISGLLPAGLAWAASGRSTFMIRGARDPRGSLRLDEVSLMTAAGRLSATGSLDTASSAMHGTVRFAAADAGAWSAPLSGGHRVAWRQGSFDLTLGGTVRQPTADIRVKAASLSLDGHAVEAPSLRARIAAAGDPGAASAQFEIDGRLDVARALLAGHGEPLLGGPISASLRGGIDRAGAATIETLRLDAAPIAAVWRGTASLRGAKGSLRVERADLAALAPFLDRRVAGRLQGRAEVDVAADPLRVSASVTASGQGLRTGDGAIDRALGDPIDVRGGLQRTPDGSIFVRDLHLATPTLLLDANGSAIRARADGRASLVVADLGRFDPRLGGRAQADVTIGGTFGALDARARIAIPSGRAMGRAIDNLVAEVTASSLGATPAGALTLSGSVGGKVASGAATVAMEPDGSASVRGLDLRVGSVRLSGDLAADAARRPGGRITLQAADLRDVAPLLLMDLSGSIDAEARLERKGDAVSAHVAATPRAIVAPGLRLGAARLRADAEDILRSPHVDGRLDLTDAAVGGAVITKMAVTAKVNPDASDLNVSGEVSGITVSGNSTVARDGAGIRVSLEALRVARGARAITLVEPAKLVVRDAEARIETLALRSGGGTLRISGRVGKTLDLRTTADAIPLSIAEIAKPGLGIEGALSGEAVLTGDPRQPAGHYKLDVANLSAAQAREMTLKPLQVETAGTFGGGRATTKTTVRGASGLQMTIAGSAPMSAAGSLDLTLKGRFDLTLANELLAVSGQQVSGRGTVDLALGGPVSTPRVAGSLGVDGGRFEDPANGVKISDLQLGLRGAERRLTITRLTGRTPGGGTLSGSGSIQLDPAAGMPADVAVKLTAARLVSSELASLVVGADLKLAGPLTRAPRVSGSVDIASLEINLPDSLPFSATPIDVKHRNAPKQVRARLARKARARGKSRGSPISVALDVTVAASARIIVRGHGVNAELGGKLAVHGTSDKPVVSGGFEARRGTLDIIGKRLTLKRGRLAFQGSLDPELDFIAESPATDVTAQVRLAGRPSDPKIIFTSTPELPRDEVLSRLLFGKPSGKLTSGQTVQLAQALAQLTGAGGKGLDDLRKSLGVDALDVGADDSGKNVGVGVGRRINDNIYVGVRQGATASSSNVTVDIDVYKGLKVEGQAGRDGQTSVGVGYEYEY